MKILSIIIPTYNMEGYLDKCLTSLILDDESLMAQLEVLVINDGSKDKSSEIAHGYADRYPQTFRVIDKENGNYGSCINRGLKDATGKYVKVLDADDWFDTLALTKVLHKLSAADVDLVLTDTNTVNDKGDITKKYQFSKNCAGLPLWSAFDFVEFIHKYRSFRPLMNNIIYRRAIFLKFNYHQTEGISYTDTEWAYIPMPHVETATYYPISLYQYLLGREGQTVDEKKFLASLPQFMKVILSMADYYETGAWDRNKYDVFMRFYLTTRLIMLNYIYFVEQKNANWEWLKDFDYKLKKHPSAYSIMGSFSYAGLPYVRLWRKCHWGWGKYYIRLMYKLLGKDFKRPKVVLGVSENKSNFVSESV